jgi:enolase
MLVAEPVDTLGDDAALATPTAIANAASEASTKPSVRFIGTSSMVAVPRL